VIELLHVEDDVDIRQITKLALEFSGGFEVVQCASGVDALAWLQNHTPDVLLFDMMMPGMTGMELLTQIRLYPRLAALPAVFMTARVQGAQLDELRAGGAVDVITKPFDPMTLGDRIKATLQTQVSLR